MSPHGEGHVLTYLAAVRVLWFRGYEGNLTLLKLELTPFLFIELTKFWQQEVFFFRQRAIPFPYSHLLCLPPCSSQRDIF